jgi:hypothetical protein
MIHDEFAPCNLGRIFKDFWNGCQGFFVLIYRNITAGTHGERLLWQGYCFIIGLTTGASEFARPWIHLQDRKGRANGKISIILSF